MRRIVAASACLLAIGACSSGRSDRAADTAAVAPGISDSANASSAVTGAMASMHRDTIAPRVQAHLARLDTSDPDSLVALVATDRQVVTTLIADCERMMREMKMEPPREWRNAVQALRQDLDRMGSMSGAQLRQLVPDHRKRIEGMLTMRRDMMRM
ncbi:MAG: hypothetical protein HOQ19_12235 [Gemmatimonadaceae bacterium]|nr:hypothetical protein [Gemmatimonadaceae bacterium]NUR35717.1 hypothetical protein [Gemmatimonadaceae bacterium]